MPKKINLKEERFILAPGFRDFNPWMLDCAVSGTCMVRQNVMAESHSPHDAQEEGTDIGEGPEIRDILQRVTSPQ
jgi:hypothetical protein